MSIHEIIMLVIAGYFTIFSFIVNTRNITSAVMFKVLPFFSAVALFMIVFKLI